MKKSVLPRPVFSSITMVRAWYVYLSTCSLGHDTFVYVLEYNEEYWYHKQQSQCAEEQSAYSPDSDRNITVGSYTRCKHKRKHAEYHRCRGHDDGTEAGFGRRYGCSNESHALFAAGGGILSEQYGGFCQQTYEHDKAYLHVDVVFNAPPAGEYETSGQTHGYGCDYCQRYRNAFIECA